jgi:hypothetical protein
MAKKLYDEYEAEVKLEDEPTIEEEVDEIHLPKEDKKSEDKKDKKWGNRILCLFLGFFIGVFSVWGTIAAVSCFILFQPIDRTVGVLDIFTGGTVSDTMFGETDEDGNILRQREVAPVAQMDKLEALRRLVLEDGIYQTVWNKLYRREVIDGILFEKGKHHEDDFWTYQIFDRMEKLAVAERPMYYYLQRSGSIIGAGYTAKRLDGLEARFLRMEYLQKYPELATLTRQQFAFDCLWHLQCVLRCLEDQEQIRTKADILGMLGCTARVPQRKLRLNLKYRVWYELLQTMPETTAKIRNKLKIGL